MAFGNPYGTGMNPMYGSVNYQQYQQNQAQFNQPFNGYGQQIQSAQRTDLIQVNGVQGAQNYQVPPNSRVALFDANSDIFYIKSTDAGGYPTVSAFQFTPIADPQGTPTEYVSRSEYDALAKKVEEMSNALISIQQTDSKLAE